jgi:hypothetical protein
MRLAGNLAAVCHDARCGRIARFRNRWNGYRPNKRLSVGNRAPLRPVTLGKTLRPMGKSRSGIGTRAGGTECAVFSCAVTSRAQA